MALDAWGHSPRRRNRGDIAAALRAAKGPTTSQCPAPSRIVSSERNRGRVGSTSLRELATPPLRALVEAHSDEIKTIVARYKGTSVAISGSVARGDETADSDIDFLVQFERRRDAV